MLTPNWMLSCTVVYVYLLHQEPFNSHSTFQFYKIKADTGIMSIKINQIQINQTQRLEKKSFWSEKPWVSTKTIKRNTGKKNLTKTDFQQSCSKTLGYSHATPAQEAAQWFWGLKPKSKHFPFESFSQFEILSPISHQMKTCFWFSLDTLAEDWDSDRK